MTKADRPAALAATSMLALVGGTWISPAGAHLAPLTPPPSAAKPAPKPLAAIRDCAADGDLDKVYPPGHLLKALRRMPSDLGAYSSCPDVLRFARVAGPLLPVSKRGIRLRVRCTGASYGVMVRVGTRTVGTARVGACTHWSRLVRVRAGTRKSNGRRKRQLATVVVKPGGTPLRFVVGLRGRRV